MLELVREYALERLRDRGELDRRSDLHADYCFALAKRAAPGNTAGPQVVWLDRLASEGGNFRAAMRWLLDRGSSGRAARLGLALWNCWWLRSRLPETLSWMAEVLPVADTLSAEERAIASLLLGLSTAGLGDHARALVHLRQALDLYRELGDPLGVAGALAAVGGTTAVTDPARGERMIREALAIFRGLQGPEDSTRPSRSADPLFYSYATWGLTQALISQGRGGEAIPLLEEAAAWAKGSEDTLARVVTVVHLGMARLDAAEITGAQAALLEALTLARELDFPLRTAPQQGTYSATVLAYVFEALAALAVETAQHEKGALLLGAAQGVRKSVGMATWAPYRHLNERAERALRTALGDDGFKAKLAEGMRMSPDDATTLVGAPR